MQHDPYVSPVSRAADATIARASYVDTGRAVAPVHGVEWLGSGWRLFRRQAGIWILLTLALGLIMIALALVPLLGQIAVTLLMPVFVGGLMIGCRKIDAGEELDLADLFAGFRRNAGNLVLIGVIGLALSILMMIPAAIILGTTGLVALMAGKAEAMGSGALLSLLVFLALIVPVNMALWFAPALVALHGESATRAIVQSFRGCLKNIAPFLIYGAILVVLAILAMIPFALGLLVFLPVLVASVYAAYRDIFLET